MKRPALCFSLFAGLAFATLSTGFCVVLPLLELFQSDRSVFSRVTTFALCLLLGSPGMLLFYTAYELREEVELYTVKNFCGVLYAFLMLASGFVLLPMALRSWGNFDSSLITFGSLFLAIAGLLPVYVAHAKALMREAGHEPLRGEWFGRQTLGLLAFLLLVCLINLTEHFGLLGVEMILGDYGDLISSVIFFSTFLIPIFFYVLAVRWLVPPTAKSE